MLALITQLDGANALLFHVEHSGNEAPWEYRWRWPSESVSPEDWSPPRRVTGESVVLPLEHPEREIEAQWRFLPVPDPASPDEIPSPGPWQAAAPHEFQDATATFVIRVKQPRDFSVEPRLRVCAAVRGHAAAFLFHLPSRVIAATGPEVLRLTGVSCHAGLGQVLREDGEFCYADDVFEVANAGASQAALLPVPAAIPGKLPFTGGFFVVIGRLTPEEIALLLQDAAVLKESP